MIDEIREFLNTEDINGENCLEFLLNNKSRGVN